MNKDLKELLNRLDDMAAQDQLTQYDEGVRDLLIAIGGGDIDIREFAMEYIEG